VSGLPLPVAIESPGPEIDPVAGRILDAALATFLDRGLRRSTVEAVATRAGVSRITVYRRFGSRDGLLEAVILREGHRFLAELERAVMALKTVEERAVEGFVTTLRLTRAHPLISHLLVAEPETLLPHLTTRGAPAIGIAREFLAGHLRRGQVEGIIGELDPDQAAEVVVRLALSFVLTPESVIALDDEERARDFARRCIAPILAGLRLPARRG